MEKPIEKESLSKIALKNSSYNLVSLFFLKFGGLIFTVILARLLLPELFGIYSLALAILTIFLAFSNLGINSSFLRYSSEALGEKKKDLFRGYFYFFLKSQIFLGVLLTLFLLISSGFIANNIYDNNYLFPILLFSSLFLFSESVRVFLPTVFASIKDFKSISFLDLVYQIIKISLSLFVLLLFSDSFKIQGLFIAFSLAAVFYIFLSLLMVYKKDKSLLKGKKIPIDKKRISRYFWFISIANLSLVLFGSVDILLLGKFVEAEYLGYYRIALSLILTVSSIFSLSGILVPIFTQIHKKRFERGFQKTFRYLIIFAIPSAVGIIFLGRYLIYLIYGNSYLLATFALYSLSPLIITGPLINLYTIVFQSKERPKIIATGILICLVISVTLNYLLIKYLLRYGQNYSIVGAGIATVISNIILLLILSIAAIRIFNLKLKGIGLKSPLFATLIMALFLLFYNKLVNMNLLFGIIEVILGAGIYLGVLILVRGINKEDFNLLKGLIKRS
jgi:O-antigen/teichoic acid export membrane protein